MELFQYTVGALSTNCYLLKSEKGNGILIDPGAQPFELLEEIRRREVTLKKIVLTHGHFDHIGGVYDIKNATGAEVLIHTEDEELLDDPVKNVSVKLGIACHPVQADAVFEEGDVITLDEISMEVIHTPGHTKGSCVLMLKNQDLLICGDTLFRGSIGRVDHYGGDQEVLLQSIQKLAALPGDYQVVSGHGRPTTLEQERRTNPYIQR